MLQRFGHVGGECGDGFGVGGLCGRAGSLYAGEPREAGGPDRLLPPAPPKPWRAWIMWAALIAGVATLGTLAWNLARQMRVNS